MITLCFAPLRFIFKNIYINKKMSRSHQDTKPACRQGRFHKIKNHPTKSIQLTALSRQLCSPLTTSYQPPLTDYFLRTTSYQLPPYYEVPITDYRLPITTANAHVPPSGLHLFLKLFLNTKGKHLLQLLCPLRLNLP